MSELVTVIMPAYNAGRFIAQSISSVVNQTYKNWEMVIVNDGSTDNTEEIIMQYVKKYPEQIHLYINEKNSGVAYTLNKAMSHAKGKYMCWLSADDLYFETMIESQVKFLEENSIYDACFSKSISINENNEMISAWNPEEYINELQKEERHQPYFNLLMIGNAFHGCSLLALRQTFIDTGEFNSEFKYAHDYEYWFRMAAIAKIGFVNEYNVMGREYPGQTSKLGRNDADAIAVFCSLARKERIISSLFEKSGLEYSREAVKDCFIYRMYLYKNRNYELEVLLKSFAQYVSELQ